MKYRVGVLVTLAALVGCLFSLSLRSFAGSQVRIVRLSDVQGAVQIDRATGQGVEKAFMNLPVTQGAKLGAGHDGFAEVEFEDGSTLRITPGTAVSFPQLEMRESGAKLSTVAVAQGVAYVNFIGTQGDQLTLSFGPETLTLQNAAHFRLGLDHNQAEVAVFKGQVQLQGPSGAVELSKKQSVVFDLTNNGQYKLAKNVPEWQYDSWDKTQDQYLQRYASNKSYNAPYAYGSRDLNYYGNFFMVPGYGMMWQPYFTGAGWDPYMNGMWDWYPGYGYGWVSTYPWGWTPYHYGSWLFVPNYGWAWQPGGSWAGLGNLPTASNSPQGFVAPKPPPSPVRTLLMVNRGPVGGSDMTSGNSANRVVIRSGSAGLGVPRGSIQNLGRVSQRVEQHGSATATIHSMTPASTAMSNSSVAMSSRGMAGNGESSRSTSPSSMPAASSRQSAPAAAPSFHGGYSAPSAPSAPSSAGRSSGTHR